MKPTKSIDILRVKDEGILKEEDILVIEYPFTIYLNDQEVITLLCSPKSLKELTLGFLYSEGFINNISNVEKVQLDEKKGVAYVYLNETKSLTEKLQGKRTITSGGCKGTSFCNVLDSFKSKKIEKPLDIKIEEIKSLVKEFNNKSQLFLDTGGVHSCALCNKSRIIMFEEDIGRHNALDKLLGKALMDNIDLSDKLVLSSGRISSEMLIKIAKRGIPALISRSAPTSLSVELARKLNITLVGFARGEKMNIYSYLTNVW
ncbi:formate dehydrogenase accessory sulfurtransferase FdhD [Haloimpatiens massiliensis]|uniref:formate dehydrogenase accessory sulfurtransferase FdhD n=1 Tax=Haloimpatiens massiliensis TaxID=1658110 RepID=UPI000C864DF7|nr:formate dehydrogenase accessory sulfurtransferase FdhD [Haloimpatiens massiliensis]